MRDFLPSGIAFRSNVVAPSGCREFAASCSSRASDPAAAVANSARSDTGGHYQNGNAASVPALGAAAVSRLTASAASSSLVQQQQFHNQQDMEFASIRNNNNNNINHNNAAAAAAAGIAGGSNNDRCRNNDARDGNHDAEDQHGNNGDNDNGDDADDDDGEAAANNEVADVTGSTAGNNNIGLSMYGGSCQQQQQQQHHHRLPSSCLYLDQIYDQQQRHRAYQQQHQHHQQQVPHNFTHNTDTATAATSPASAALPTSKILSSGASCSMLRITNRQKNYALWFVTPMMASFAVAIVIASLAGPQWMLTTERLPNPAFNGTPNAFRPDDGAFVFKYTKSSLWILCMSPQPGFSASGVESTCMKIDYFPREEYSPDPNDSTMAIPYAVTRSTPFFLMSGGALLISYMVLITAMCSPHRHHVYFFTSGILFIISGLIMLIGLIMYVSIFKAEIGSKLRPRTPMLPAMFTFEYGQSFCLFVIGFILTELVGMLNVFLFIGLQQIRVTGDLTAMPCFLAETLLPEKAREGGVKEAAVGGVAVGSSGGFCSPVTTQRRYYLEKLRNCDVHQSSSSASNMLLDNRLASPLARKPSITFSMRSTAQQFPLTRSVSTATELFDAQDRRMAAAFQHNNSAAPERLQNAQNGRLSSALSQSTHHLHSASNSALTAGKMPMSIGSMNSILSGRNVQQQQTPSRLPPKSKEELFREFCDRAGRRYNPKEIYFIDMSDESDNRQQQRYAEHKLSYGHSADDHHHQHQQQQTATPSQNNYNLYASNSSLHKSYPKNLFELEQRGRGIQNDIRAKPNLGASTDSRMWRQSNEPFSSQTLPRNFLKHNADVVGNYQHVHHAQQMAAQYALLPPLQQQHQQQRQQAYGQRYGNHRFEGRSSHDNLLQTRQQQQHQQQSRLSCSKDDIVNWPNAIPASPSSFSTRSQFYSQRAGTSARDSYAAVASPHRRQQQQQQRYGTGCHSPDAEFGPFDLDRIENERRKSHASLFEGVMDFENGTAV